MYGIYNGIRPGLSPGDLAGIQALYGARSGDAYQQQGQGLAVSSAIDITSSLSAAHQATLNNVSLATIGDTEYFSVVAPSFAGATLEVTATAGNISLLSPQVTILDSTGKPLDVQGNPNAWGDNITAQTSQIVPGQRYIIAVTGATDSFFAVGAYQLAVSCVGDPSVVATPPGAASSPTPAPAPAPAPTTAPGTAAPLSAPVVPIAPMPGEPASAATQTTALGTVTTASVGSLSLGTGSTERTFSFRTAHAGVYRISAPGATIRAFNGSGKLVAAGEGVVTIRSRRSRAPFVIEIGETSGTPVATYSLSISPVSTGLRQRAHGVPAHRVTAPRIHRG
jgi:hypothetical protein